LGSGIAVQVDLPFTCKNIPFAAPKTGYPSDETGKIVAENIIRLAKGRTDLKRKAWVKFLVCVLWMLEKKK
jgi:sulfide:quinone oxidoreductase